MYPYIIRFNHAHDDGSVEEMFLCLHARSMRLAAEMFWSMIGGVGQPNVLVSIRDKWNIEFYHDSATGRFYTITERED